jgi:DNA adenine methylase
MKLGKIIPIKGKVANTPEPEEVNLLTPINYYGGKTNLAPKILQLIPPHEVYTECFFGGGAVFFAKEPAKIEAINDTNDEVINFYRVCKNEFKALSTELDKTLFSEKEHQRASMIYNNSKKYTNVERAWALIVLSQQSFLNIIDNSWKFQRMRNTALGFQNKKEMIDQRYLKRLEGTQIFNRDANRVLENMDRPEAFHFIDPPYFQANMGHYDGYSEQDFEALLKTCEKLEGKFMLTTFPSPILEKYRKRNKWYQFQIKMKSSAKTGNNQTGKASFKVEVMTMNYKPSNKMISLFEEKLIPSMAA